MTKAPSSGSCAATRTSSTSPTSCRLCRPTSAAATTSPRACLNGPAPGRLDVRGGHHLTSSLPGAGPFQTMLIVSRFTETGHVTITSGARTLRRPGQETVHEELTVGQVIDAVADLGLPLDTQTARELGQRLQTGRAHV